MVNHVLCLVKVENIFSSHSRCRHSSQRTQFIHPQTENSEFPISLFLLQLPRIFSTRSIAFLRFLRCVQLFLPTFRVSTYREPVN